MKFSVIIPTYNRSDLLRETINSVLNQSFKDYEIIVVNDGSTDNTSEVLSNYGDKIRVIHKENSGAEKSRNAGADIAKGEYFSFLDSDDLMFPWTLSVYNKIIDTYNPALVICSAIKFEGDNLNGNHLSIPEYCEYIVYKNYLEKTLPIFTSSSVIVVRKDIFMKANGFRDKYKIKEYYLDDDYFIQKIAAYGPFIFIVHPNLIAYRIHKGNSRNDLKRVLISLEEILRAIKSNEFGTNSDKYQRLSIVGGLAFFWIRKALYKNMYSDVFKLFSASFLAIILTIIRKIKTKLSKKKKIYRLPLN